MVPAGGVPAMAPALPRSVVELSVPSESPSGKRAATPMPAAKQYPSRQPSPGVIQVGKPGAVQMQPAVAPCALFPRKLIHPLVPPARLVSSIRFENAAAAVAYEHGIRGRG